MPCRPRPSAPRLSIRSSGASTRSPTRPIWPPIANWSIHNCVNQHSNNVAAGAVVGGIFGALVGAAVAGPYAAGAGAAWGGAVGLGTGAAVAASSGAYCPNGYVVRAGALASFAYGGPVYAPPVAYAAPYRPWVWIGGRWVYRPYPNGYHHPYAPGPYAAPGYH